MENKKKPKQFLEKPQYPGGSKALREFINSHLQYPEDAMEQRIEGVVSVAYQVTDEGEVEYPTVIKGLCPSCDAEAVRLVKMLKYGKAHNRGVRLKSNCKVNIKFKLAPTEPVKMAVSYTTTPSKPKTKKQPRPKGGGGGYSITWNS